MIAATQEQVSKLQVLTKLEVAEEHQMQLLIIK